MPKLRNSEKRQNSENSMKPLSISHFKRNLTVKDLGFLAIQVASQNNGG